MRKGSIVVALFTLVGAGNAWAAGGGAATAAPAAGTYGGTTAGMVGSRGPTTVAPPATATTVGGNAAAPGAGLSNNDVNTPPPPLSVTARGSNNGVPPTPAQAFPGLPSPTQTGSLPSDRGFDAQTANELRPSSSLNAGQVADVQASLAAGGLYRGPIDGNLTAATRAAVRQFQQTSRLPETGELDAQTMSLLQRSSVAGSTGANGNTSTTGNRAAAGDPFAIGAGLPAAASTGTTNGGQTGPIFSQPPFQLSTPLNTSPATPALQP